ncbi:hypothetical protein OQX63_17355 [Pedobacter sp. PF22-3]|uniref:DUF6804 family protein n=1 Tax=Pedobacter sp. PF22-3 TaxID=2994467 RepID=UPI0022473068|nr:DUF6804 family protein [Pedobacter sp. PF22-3]MCX2495261.1 hypothetical protein [Pedobacter sp. PF22-3]
MDHKSLKKIMVFKILIALMLFSGILNVSFIPYQTVHFASGISFIVLCYFYWKAKKKIFAALCIIGVIFYNPTFKMPIGAKYYLLTIDKWMLFALIVWLITDIILLKKLNSDKHTENITA